MHLFQNHAVLQRPADNIIKALQRFPWQEFGISAQVRQPADHLLTLCCTAVLHSLCTDLPACRLSMGRLARD